MAETPAATQILRSQVAKEPRAAGGQGPEQPRNGKAVGDAKPRGLEGDWRAAKEKPAGDQDVPEGESQAERMRREFEEERQRLQEQRKKGGHTAQRAANVRTLSWQIPATVMMLLTQLTHPVTGGLPPLMGVLSNQGICDISSYDTVRCSREMLHHIHFLQQPVCSSGV